MQGFHFTWKPGKTWENLEFEKLKKKPRNTWDFKQKSQKKTLKNPELKKNLHAKL